MGKTQLSALLVLIASIGYSQTIIPGGIYQNTSWSPIGNPYIASGNVVVFEDVSLTIEPGVIVRFNSGASLEIRGKLTAIGTPNDSIRFTSNLSAPARNSWNGIIVKGTNSNTGDGHQITMEYCVGEYANYFIDLDIAYEGPYVFRHCYFRHNYQTNDDGGIPLTLFDHCRFDSNINAIGFSGYELSVTNCEFEFNEIGVGGASLVDSCYFANHSIAALLGNEIVTNCTIVKNKVGVDCAFNSGSRTFVGNIVKNNDIGIRMQKYFIGHIDFYRNVICDNTSYNLELLDFNNAIIPFNCWCSEDSAYIRSTIFDGFVNTNYGLVRYTPLDDGCPETTVRVKSDLRKNALSAEVYPNPFIDELNVKFPSDHEAEVILYDLNGRELLRQQGESIISLNTTYLPEGIFVYEVITNGGFRDIGKVIKVR